MAATPRPRRRLAVLGALMAGLLLSACPAAPSAGDRGSCLVADIDALSSARLGEPVAFTMTVRNGCRRAIQIAVRGEPEYDFVVRRAEAGGGGEVWRWLHGQVIPMRLALMDLAPGEEHDYTATWDQRDNNGAPVPPGTYEAVGTLARLPVGNEPAEPVTTPPAVFTLSR